MIECEIPASGCPVAKGSFWWAMALAVELGRDRYTGKDRWPARIDECGLVVYLLTGAGEDFCIYTARGPDGARYTQHPKQSDFEATDWTTARELRERLEKGE